MTISITQMLEDAKRLSERLRQHEASTDGIISSAQDNLKELEAMKQYSEDIDALNALSNNRPRAQLVLGIQQENRHIRQLQQENKELRAALEESQNALELIMSKYRHHVLSMVNTSKDTKNILNYTQSKVLQDRADKICEMAAVMNQAIQIDDENQAKEKELISKLLTENMGLREMLEISRLNGSLTNPLAKPKMVSRTSQTEMEIVNNNVNTVKPLATSEQDTGGKGMMSLSCNSLHSINSLKSNEDGRNFNMSDASSNSSNSPNSSVTSIISVVSNNNFLSSPSSPPPPPPIYLQTNTEVESSSSEETDEEDEITYNTVKRNQIPTLGKRNSDRGKGLIIDCNNEILNGNPPAGNSASAAPPSVEIQNKINIKTSRIKNEILSPLDEEEKNGSAKK